jgi:hypothetical protein
MGDYNDETSAMSRKMTIFHTDFEDFRRKKLPTIVRRLLYIFVSCIIRDFWV